MKRVLITLADFLVLGVLLPEKNLTGANTLVQVQQTILLKNTHLQAFSYEVRAREAEKNVRRTSRAIAIWIQRHADTSQ
jgi:hypothetical protein